MNRFEYASAIFQDGEQFVAKHRSMKLYNGDQKVCNFNAFLSN